LGGARWLEGAVGLELLVRRQQQEEKMISA